MTNEAEPLRCAYVLPKKGRKCRMLVKAGNKFCGEHAVHDVTKMEDRIPCPNDPKHSISKTQLESHLKVCNARLPEEPWIKEGFNCVKGETRYDAKIDKRPTTEELTSIIGKIDKCFDSISEDIEDAFLTTAEVSKFLDENPNYGSKHRKHLQQISSIIGHLTLNSLLINNDTSCLFELGAGKAQLSYWMAKVAPKCSFILMDRSGARNKFDNKAIHEDSNLRMKRIRCSVEHLDLSAVGELQGADSLSAVCKHFCGSATDAGIRCLLNGVKNGLPLDGFVLVPCCHHKSRQIEYCGQEFFSEWDIKTEGEYAALRHVASWANCGFGEDKESEETEPKKPKVEDETVADSIWSNSWKLNEGRKAKIIFEMGRARYLEKAGFKTKVMRYIDYSVSPENLLILANK